MQLNGFEVRIFLRQPDGTIQDLEEFDLKSTAASCTAHICSVDGAHFGIKVSSVNASKDVSMKYLLDGQSNMRSTVVKAKDYVDVMKDSTGIKRGQRAKLRFSRITAEGDSNHESAASGSKLGTIEVNLYHITNIRFRGFGRVERDFALDLAAANEKALKERKQVSGVPPSHQISLTDTFKKEKSKPKETFDLVSPTPIATFIFSYGSRGVLEACGIVPSAVASTSQSNAASAYLDASNSSATDRAIAETREEYGTEEKPDIYLNDTTNTLPSISRHGMRGVKREAEDVTSSPVKREVKRERLATEFSSQTCIDLTRGYPDDGEGARSKPIVLD